MSDNSWQLTRLFEFACKDVMFTLNKADDVSHFLEVTEGGKLELMTQARMQGHWLGPTHLGACLSTWPGQQSGSAQSLRSLISRVVKIQSSANRLWPRSISLD